MKFREILLNSYFKFRRRDTLTYLKKLEKTQYLPINEIKQIQFKKLKALLNHAYKNVPFYRNLFKKVNFTPDDFKSLEDIEKIPIITKEDINLNLSEMIASNYTEKYLKANSTGGSTGYNMKFYNDLKRGHIRQAFVMRGNRWAGLNLGTKHALLWGNPIDQASQDSLMTQISNKIMGSIFLSSYQLSDINIQEYADKLYGFDPEVLIAYPSVLYLFSEVLNENNLKIPKLNSIITSAETLYDYQREFIESIFNCNIYNRYGCREFGPIAHECTEHVGLHVNSEHLYLEYLDKNLESTDGEEYCNIYITDLDNYAMPFIRYEIGDIAKLIDTQTCNCGRTLPLIEVEGRNFNVIECKNGLRIGSTFWTHYFRDHIKNVEKFQVIQDSKNHIRIDLAVTSKFESNVLNTIKKELSEYCGNDMNIDVEVVDDLEDIITKSGKRNFIINELLYKKI